MTDQAPAPAAPAPAPAPAEPSSDVLGPGDLQRIMTHDPFNLPMEGDPAPAPAEPTDPAPQPQTAPAPQSPLGQPAPQQPVATQPPAVAGPDPLLQQVAQQVQQLTQQQRQQQPVADDLPAYEFDIPDQLVTVLASENPAERKAGIQHLVKGIGRAIHTQIREDFARAMPQVIQAHLQRHTAQQEIFRDFYGAHPDLNDPQLRQHVVTAAGLLMPQFGGQWSPQLRDAIARHVRTTVGRQPPQPAPAPVAQAPAAPAQPHVMQPGTRPAPMNPSDAQAQMLDLLVYG